MRFTVAHEVRELGVVGSYFLIRDLNNNLVESGLQDWVRSCVDALVEPNEEILTGFRTLHSAVGRSNRKFVASPENLWKLFLRRGALPRVSPIVDIYNAISLRSCLALGAHDVARIDGNVILRLTTGDEGFHPLGAEEPKAVAPGEYSYVDDSNDVICRMEVRQVEKTKVTDKTVDCFYIVQGNPSTPEDIVHQVASELISTTTRFCGGEVEHLWPPAN